MFPIGWMYYFGTNLESRFSVPDFWPEPESTHKIPFEKDDQLKVLNQLKESRLEKRRRRLEKENGGGQVDERESRRDEDRVAQALPERRLEGEGPAWGVGSVEKWARGR